MRAKCCLHHPNRHLLDAPQEGYACECADPPRGACFPSEQGFDRAFHFTRRIYADSPTEGGEIETENPLNVPYVILLVVMVIAAVLLACLSAGAAAQRLLSAEWSYLGPFPVGKTEIDGDPVAALYESIHDLAPHDGTRIPSELATGGEITWVGVTPEPVDLGDHGPARRLGAAMDRRRHLSGTSSAASGPKATAVRLRVPPPGLDIFDVNAVFQSMARAVEAVEVQGWLVGEVIGHAAPGHVLFCSHPSGNTEVGTLV